jgi:hypothetical protein
VYYHGCPEYSPDIAVPLEKLLVPLILHKLPADARTGQAAAGEKYQQPCYQIDDSEYKNYPNSRNGTYHK